MKKKNNQEHCCGQHACTCSEANNYSCDGECACEECTCDSGGCGGHKEGISSCVYEDNSQAQDILYYIDTAQRIKADFDNYRKRNADVASNSFNNGVVFAVEKLLPVVDGVSQARLGIKDESILKGFDIINTQFLDALGKLGVKKIECVGHEFDPNFHNAVLTDSVKGKKDGVVLEEFQQGFMLGDKVIRHSVVKINKL